jgi:multiple sugar transport system permease protein
MLLSLLVFYTIPGIAYALPLYVIYGKLKIQDTPFGLVIIFIALTIPFATWVLHGYFVSIPRDLEDCAMVDGCSRLGALIRIVLPLSAPGVAATMILTFIATWNNFLYPAILAGSRTKTLTVAMSAFLHDLKIEWGPAAAVASAVILPVTILIILAQKYIILGLVSGSVKE